MGSIRFWHLRVTLLLAILLGVLVYAWRDFERRRTRRLWQRPVQVALVLVEHEPLSAGLTGTLHSKVPELEAHLNDVARTYLPVDIDAFQFHWFGPIAATRAPPLDTGDGLLGELEQAWELWRYASQADAAAGIDSGAYDVRIYLAAYAGRGRAHNVEGVGEDGGRVGVVRVELAKNMIDFTLVVAAHEMFHTLGATDRYDSTGRTLIPDGLAEPGLRPLYPQRFVEVMDRNRPISATESVPPEDIRELAVGPRTAREIGWLPPTP